MLERGISPRSLPPPEHNAHVPDLPRCIPVRRQLVWSVALATLINAPLLEVGGRLALGAPLGSGSDPGVSGYLRVALRTRVSGSFARFGCRSERCRVLDGVCVCPIVWTCKLRVHRNASRIALYAVLGCSELAYELILPLSTCGTPGARVWCVYVFFLDF